jgi:apolipoprotein N-acyltransferase
MTAIEFDAHAPRANTLAQITGRPLIWLAIGALASLFATGWGLSIALAAWIAPVFLLRFSRVSRPLVAMGGLVAISLIQIAWMGFESATNFFGNSVTTVLTSILGVIFIIPYAIDRLLVSRLNAIGRLLLFPAGAAAIEFVVGVILPTGTSMGMKANTQAENLALMQIISLTGPYAIGFLIAAFATVVNHIWENPNRDTAIRWGGAFAAALLAIVAFGQIRLTAAGWTGTGSTVKVAGVTPSIALRTAAWKPVTMANFPPSAATRAAVATPEMKARYAAVQDELLAKTRTAAQAGAKIVLWSETGAPVLEADMPALLRKIAAVARAEHIYVDAAIGVPFERNETYLVAPDGRVQWHYRKNHPVPGLEPVAPFANAAPVADTPFGRLSNIICYDGDFPTLTRAPVDIMLLPGWDWPEMGYTHTMKMARLRAIENGYALVRIDFIGVSAAFDAYGRVIAMQDTVPDSSHTLLADVPNTRVWTLYSRIGDVFAWLCIALALGLCGMGIVRPVRNAAA